MAIPLLHNVRLKMVNVHCLTFSMREGHERGKKVL